MLYSSIALQDAVAYSGTHFGEGSGPYHYSSFGCSGIENSILNCSHVNYLTAVNLEERQECLVKVATLISYDMKNFIELKKFAGAYCYSFLVTPCNHGDVRLEDGYTDVEGRVEVCINGQWGTVCDDNTDQSAFDFICRRYFDSNQCKWLAETNEVLLLVYCQVSLI